MSKVVSISDKPVAALRIPQPSIVETLEKLLADAMDGRIQHLIAVYSDGVAPPTDCYVGTGEPAHVMQLIGGMELCKHTILMGAFEETTDYR